MYIQGRRAPVVHTDPDTGKRVSSEGVQTFVHIRKPGTKKETLCGSVISRVQSKTEKRPKHDLCTACRRISDGQDPVFDKPGRTSRPPESIGTRAAVPALKHEATRLG